MSGPDFSCVKGGNHCAFSSVCPGMGQKEKQEMGLKNRQQSNYIYGVRLFITQENEFFHYFSCY